MGSSPEDWIHAHAYGMLWAIEVMWVAGFLAVFVVYFMVKRWIKKKKTDARVNAEIKKEPLK